MAMCNIASKGTPFSTGFKKQYFSRLADFCVCVHVLVCMRTTVQWSADVCMEKSSAYVVISQERILPGGVFGVLRQPASKASPITMLHLKCITSPTQVASHPNAD